jgi:hypothetical protein
MSKEAQRKRIKMTKRLLKNDLNFKEFISDQSLANLAKIRFGNDVVVVDDTGNGYIYNDRSKLWENKSKKQITNYLCKQLKIELGEFPALTKDQLSLARIKVSSASGINGIF